MFFNGIDNQMRDGLWVTDGTRGGTQLLNFRKVDSLFYPFFPTKFFTNEIKMLCIYNEQLLFAGYDSVNRVSLWITDGTISGTKFLKHFTGTDGSGGIIDGDNNFYAPYYYYNQKIYFNTGVYENPVFGILIGNAVTDATPGGTSLDSSGINTDMLAHFVQCNNKYYLSGDYFTYGTGLYVTANVDSPLMSLTSFACTYNMVYPDPYPIAACIVNDNQACYNNELYFAGGSYNDSELWKTDGSSQGTVLIKDILTGRNGSYPKNLFDFNNRVYFTADDSIHGRELWVSDGTALGTQLVKDIFPGQQSSSHDGFKFYPVNGNLMMVDIGEKDVVLSDGTATGTYTTPFNINVINWQPAFYQRYLPQPYISYNGNYLYAIADWNNSLRFNGILKSDGSLNGTNMIYMDANSSTFTKIDSMSNEIYFVNKTLLPIPVSIDSSVYYRLEKLSGIDSVYSGEEKLSLDEFHIFPNPATNSVSIIVDEIMLNSNLTIIDIIGNIVATAHLTAQQSLLNTEFLPSGVYIVTLTANDGRRTTKKLIINN